MNVRMTNLQLKHFAESVSQIIKAVQEAINYEQVVPNEVTGQCMFFWSLIFLSFWL